jgi:hypothetical protein
MADAVVHFDQDTGLSLYVQFDDSSNIRVQLTEGTLSKLRRYAATDAAIQTAGLAAGKYNGTIRIGLAVSPTDTDQIVGVLSNFQWSGSVELLPQVDTRQLNGTAPTLTADGHIRVDVASWNRYLFSAELITGQNIKVFFNNAGDLTTKIVDEIPIGFDLTETGVENFKTLVENEAVPSDTTLDDLAATAAPITVHIDQD